MKRALAIFPLGAGNDLGERAADLGPQAVDRCLNVKWLLTKAATIAQTSQSKPGLAQTSDSEAFSGVAK